MSPPRVGIDVGGTFTDLGHVDPDRGTIQIRKVASTPDDPSQGLFRALEELASPVPFDALVHGTTVATNALLERGGARSVLVTTAGFEDLLWLRRQDRPALYDLARDHVAPLVARDDVVGARERMGPDGVLLELADAEIERVAGEVRARRPEAVAIALLFAFRHPDHERRLTQALRTALPGIPVAASHEVLPVFREYERTSTTTAEAYLRPKVGGYVSRLASRIPSLRIMTSSGGTLSPEQAGMQAARLALSGPAGGVVGARLIGAALDIGELLTLDMGGTSADASVITGGAPLMETGMSVAGLPLGLPAILIETVSAGGGSIATLDEGGALRVGPRSAGAVPGPACYGRGGTEPTVTDACLALGWLDAAHPIADGLQLDRSAAERALAQIAETLGSDVCRVAAGITTVATAVMARALKRVSVARGIDPRGMALLPFGGAGPLFGCALADALGMSLVVIPPSPGVLSALGLAAAPERVETVASCHRALAEMDSAALAALFAPLDAAAQAALPGAGTRFEHQLDCRYAGQGYELTMPVLENDASGLAATFHAAHRVRHGHADPTQPVEIINARVVAERRVAVPVLRSMAHDTKPTGVRQIVTRGTAVRADVWPLGAMAEGTRITGPAVLAGPDASALIEPGWRGTVHASGAVIVERT
jgi:N-methylhydantoinase A